VVLARQRARQIAEILGFEPRDQVRIATAVSEIARNAHIYATGGVVEFSFPQTFSPALRISITDKGPGISNLKEILDGYYTSSTGMGMGILGARRLMDEFDIRLDPGGGTRVVLAKFLPRNGLQAQLPSEEEVSLKLAQQVPQNPMEELQRQNQELIATLSELEKRQNELAQLNKELEDTNRGVVALYAELDEKADYLGRASELKTQFLSNMSHEFRTPLNSVLSLSRMLLDRLDGDLSSEQEKQVRFIETAAKDLSELVNDLLDLAKVEAGKVTIRPMDFSISDLFGALRGMLRPLLAHNSSVSLIFDESEDFPQLHTDESKVSQIVRNLISNALKFTEKGEVRAWAWMESNGQVAISVRDTGIGIAPCDQESIFGEFAQVEGPHQTGKKGTGLGLPLSRKLAELLGGTLKVESELGKGSTFTLRIPTVYRGATEVSVFQESREDLDPTRRPILVVEDNSETLFIYSRYFDGTEFQLVPVSSLKQARQALESFKPWAILLDILLNKENAWGFLAELKNNEATKEIPVVVITVLENEGKAKSLGADEFFHKPIDRAQLLGKLESFARQERTEELLIIDDDEASRYLLKGFLDQTRFRIRESSNALTGLKLARECKPAAIFLDLVMPDRTGFEFLDDIQADAACKNIPVIVHTAKVLTPEELQRLESRTVALIPKIHADRQLSLKRIREAIVKAKIPDLRTESEVDHA
jgi:signal transduction histidine kinase/CheY-like chemotaxis protein